MNTQTAPFSVYNGAAQSDLLLVCDHASNFIPKSYACLGLPQESLERHIAYDIGTAHITRALAERFDCVAVLAGFSRLLIDANRGIDDPTLVMKLSDGEIIPGNRHVDPYDDKEEWQRRIDDHYLPYHEEVAKRVKALQGKQPALLSVHSFTPIWKGKPRIWDIGMLWGKDGRFAEALVEGFENINGLEVGRNQPYAGGMEGESVQRHGENNGILYVSIEIRQDHLQSPEGCDLWVERLARLVPEALAKARQNPLY